MFVIQIQVKNGEHAIFSILKISLVITIFLLLLQIDKVKFFIKMPYFPSTHTPSHIIQINSHTLTSLSLYISVTNEYILKNTPLELL